jgi:hypothetical protein
VGLAFDTSGNLYVSNRADNTIRKFSPTGADLGFFATTGMVNPVGLAFSPFPTLRIETVMTAVSGTPFDVTVTAVDSSGNIDTAYQGTVTFSTTDPDSGAVLPADYTFPRASAATMACIPSPAG